MKQTILFLLFSISLPLFSQEISLQNDSLKIEIRNTYSVTKNILGNNKNLKVDGVTLKKVGIIIKIKNTFKSPLPMSAFSLIDTKNKLRYRADDFTQNSIAAPSMNTNPSTVTFHRSKGYFTKFRKEKLYTKNGSEIITRLDIPDLDPSEIDYFSQYKIENFTDLEFTMDYGSKNNPKKTITYLGSLTQKRAYGGLEFRIPELFLTSEYDLYYKDEKVGSVTF